MAVWSQEIHCFLAILFLLIPFTLESFLPPNSYCTTPKPQADTSQNTNNYNLYRRVQAVWASWGYKGKHSNVKLLLNRYCVKNRNKPGEMLLHGHERENNCVAKESSILHWNML